MYINISYYNQLSKKQNNIMYRVNIEEFVNLDDKDLYELTFDTIDLSLRKSVFLDFGNE